MGHRCEKLLLMAQKKNVLILNKGNGKKNK